MHWLNLGDTCEKYFFIKIKQRKMANFIYIINDATRRRVEGFNEGTKVMIEYYQYLLGQQRYFSDPIDTKVIDFGTSLTLDQWSKLCASYSNDDIKKAIVSIPISRLPGSIC